MSCRGAKVLLGGLALQAGHPYSAWQRLKTLTIVSPAGSFHCRTTHFYFKTLSLFNFMPVFYNLVRHHEFMVTGRV